MDKTLKHAKSLIRYKPDFQWGDTAVELKTDPHSFRNIRDGLMQLVYYLADQPNRRGLLLLDHPRIADAALKEEWRLAEQSLKKSVLDRLSVAVKRGDEINVLAGQLKPTLRKHVHDLILREEHFPRVKMRPASEAVFLMLLLHWFRRSGPLTTNYLMQAVGCSYPTVATTVQRLGSWIKRLSDRSIQLCGFPTEEWQRVVAMRDRAHPIIRYVDRSGQPRSPETLLERASHLDNKDLAVGGVIAARHYYPEVDLRGTPRLDLTVHCPPKGQPDLSFVERLDPALERSEDNNEPASLAIHVLTTQKEFFTPASHGLPLADEVDCLLSMHDARLDAQAKEFLNHLVTSVG